MKKTLIFSVICACLLASCNSHKKVPYIVGAEELSPELLATCPVPGDPVIQPGDLLNIEITGNSSAVIQFNKGAYLDNDKLVRRTVGNYNQIAENGVASTDYYLVNKEGYISFPIIGEIHVAGETKTQVAEAIINAIYPKYVKERPAVDIRFMNFRVTVLGAVKNPGVKVSQNERLNIFEALAMAGDMDIRGDRENVILIKTSRDGKREVHKINMQDRDLLMSPLFNLSPNDILLVNYNRSGAQNSWQMNQGFTATVSVIGGVSALAALIISVINVSK